MKWPWKSEKKVVGYITTFPAMTNHHKLIKGEMSIEEYATAPVDPISQPIVIDTSKRR